MNSCTDVGNDGQPGSKKKALSISMVIGLAIWGLCLGIGLVATMIKPPVKTITPVIYAGIYAAIGAVYFTTFTHCLMRLAHSRWRSWFFYTAAFAALTATTVIGPSTNLLTKSNVSEYLQILRLTLFPLTIMLLLMGVQASKARASGYRTGWRSYARAIALTFIIYAGWRLGALDEIGQILRNTNIDPRLAASIVSVTLLTWLIYETQTLAGSKQDEIAVPMCYWSVSVFMASVMSLAFFQNPQTVWLQTKCLELAGVIALVIGLSLENEFAHRGAASRMEDLNALQKVSWSLVGASNLDELCATLVRVVAGGFKASAVAVYLPYNAADELTLAAIYGIDDSSIAVGNSYSIKPERRPGFHSGHTARAFQTGKVQIVREVFSDVEFLPWRTLARSNGIAVSVPLPYQGKVIGVLNIFLPEVYSIDERRMRLLETIAAAVSPAIESIKHDHISDRYHELVA
ncbi:MAG TPA: GAF domain-containing protein [Armatimonadota bacterium]|nr:GAF domain-containing protein [Armatimonadota bacterium]HPP74402.1 GAF domain-containing protein [Armatimonadota bacterium]